MSLNHSTSSIKSNSKKSIGKSKKFGNIIRNTTLALLSQGQINNARSDEVILPAGTSVVELSPATLQHLRNTQTSVGSIIREIDESKALLNLPFSQTISLTAGQGARVYSFGEQSSFFVRLSTDANGNSHPEISTDLQTWQPYTSGQSIDVLREEVPSSEVLSGQLETYLQLQQEKQDLETILTQQELALSASMSQLSNTQAFLNQAEAQLDAADIRHGDAVSEKATKQSTLSAQGQLRNDMHPVVTNSGLSDDTKTSQTSSALTKHDNATAGFTANNVVVNGIVARGAREVFVLPNLSDVNATISALQTELSRLQTQINQVTSQITAKNGEITTTQNTITQKEQTIAQLTSQINANTSDYVYWDNEYTRLGGLINTVSSTISSLRTDYSSKRTRVINEAGRIDIPSNMDASDFLSSITQVKGFINAEILRISTPTNQWGTDTTTKNRSNLTSSTTTRLDSQYYYTITYNSLSKSFPAVIKTYVKATGDSSFAQGETTYTVLNDNHLVAVVNNKIKPIYNKFCDYAYVDRLLETTAEQFVSKKADYNSYVSQSANAFGKRTTAKNNLDDALILVNQRKSELTTLETQKTLLATQKSELETLKSLKAQLQSLYNRVQTIIGQIQGNISSYQSLTTEITNLLQLANTLRNQINDLTIQESQLTEAVDEYSEGVESSQAVLSEKISAQNLSRQKIIEVLVKIKTGDWSRDPIDESVAALTTPAQKIVRTNEKMSYGHRTSTNSLSFVGNTATLPYRAIVHYLDTGADPTTEQTLDVYPATLTYEYKIGGRVYRTPSLSVNNFEHKGLMGSASKFALEELSEALKKRVGVDANQGMKNMWEAVQKTLASMKASVDTNADFRAYENISNTLRKSIVLSGASQAFFDHLIANEPSFATLLGDAVDTVALGQGISIGSDEYSDLRFTLIHIFAQQFGEERLTQGFSGLTSYTDYRVTAEAFMANMRNNLQNPSKTLVDINDEWLSDDHGNKYKYGVVYGADGGYPARLWMSYSPDGHSTQTMGPVTIENTTDMAKWKERWRVELLKSKNKVLSNTNYNGGAYDIFQGWGEDGERVWWGKLIDKLGLNKSVSFNNSSSIVEKLVKLTIEKSNEGNLSPNEAYYRSLFNIAYDNLKNIASVSLNSLLQVSDNYLSTSLGNILDYSFNVSTFSSKQKDIAKVIISISGIPGYSADEIKDFQLKAIQQLIFLGTNFEQEIIKDVQIGQRNGDLEELRTFVVLQKLSELFIRKGNEMEKVKEAQSVDPKNSKDAGEQMIKIIMQLNYAGVKRLYYVIEEQEGESNIKANKYIRTLCATISENGSPSVIGGRIRWIKGSIDMSDVGNLLLGYNAKKLGLSLEETIFGSSTAQTGIYSIEILGNSLEKWRKGSGDISGLIETFNNTTRPDIIKAFNDETGDHISYSRGFNMEDVSPKNILQQLK